jgi:hypothetical protein
MQSIPSPATESETRMTNTPVFVAGNSTVHAGRRIGTYPSGAARYAKRCGGLGRDRHEPIEARGAQITCKRCLAKIASEGSR